MAGKLYSTMVDEKLLFQGIPTYPGRIYARTKKLKSSDTVPLVKKTDLPIEEREKEIENFLACLKRTEEELNQIIEDCVHVAGGIDLISILSSQKEILHDPEFKDRIIHRIRIHGENAALAIENTVRRIQEDFLELEDEFFRERADHIMDIGKRVSQNLAYPQGKKGNSSIQLSSPCILIAKDISPSELLSLDKSMILGIATDHGGKTGHMAIIARNYGIPTIVGLKNLSNYIEDGEYLLLDADRGFVKRSPDWEEFKSYGERCSLNHSLPIQKSTNETKSLDGMQIDLKVNLETHNDCETILLKNPAGIGLYRSEVLYMQFPDHSPTEEEQFHIYKFILRSMKELPVTIRVFDIGADKYEIGIHEDNPFLGNRGIRFLLKHPALFKEQLRALLRASVFGNLQILIPMVSTISEIRSAIRLFSEAKQELEEEGIPYKETIPLGIMVETPVCAMGLEYYLPYVDFLSVGTNDLLQYIMAVERNNYAVSDLYNPYHFVFLDLLERIVKVAQKMKKPISICGEIATDPMMTGILLAMGYKDLSVSPPFLEPIREKIRNMRIRKERSRLKKIRNLAIAEKYYDLGSLLESSFES